ncbi:hypothetical protein AB9E03_34065, partial [Rhizobium leguminosarum]
KKAVEEDDDHELSDANRASILFPIRVLQLSEEAGRKGERLTFSDYAKLVVKLSNMFRSALPFYADEPDAFHQRGDEIAGG